MSGITLKFGGNREAGGVSVEEAEKVKARWESEMAAEGVVVTKVDLGCRQWTADGIKVITPILERTVPTVQILDIQDTIAGLETSVGFEIMEMFTAIFKDAEKLVEINMNDNATGPRVLERIATLLSHPGVKRVFFHNCGMSAETMPQLDEALKVKGSGPGMVRLEALTLNKNMIGVEGAKFVGERLADSVKLADFSYCGCRPTTEGTKYLAEGLKNLVEGNPDAVVAMKDLKLEDCDLVGSDGDFAVLEDLGKALQGMPHLTHLDISDNGDLEETGAGIVAQALKTSNCNLVELNLSSLCLGEDGAEAVAEMLREKLSSLKVLKLELNELGNDGVEKILSAFKGDNCLERLYFDENELDDSAIDVLLGANLPNLVLLSLKDNMDMEEADDDKKEELRKKFANATVIISDEDAEAAEAAAKETSDADIDALAAATAKLGV